MKFKCINAKMNQLIEGELYSATRLRFTDNQPSDIIIVVGKMRNQSHVFFDERQFESCFGQAALAMFRIMSWM